MSICTVRGPDRGQPQPIDEQGVAVIYGEDLRLGLRSLLGRPAESLLLAVGVALAVGASVAGITLAVATESISERLLSSLHYREIAVTTTALGADAPAWKKPPTSVELTIDDLARARSVTQAVQYAYTAEDTSFHVEPIGDPRPRLEEVNGIKVTRDFFAARELQAAAGSLFTPDDLERGEPVMVVGAELAATLFEDGVALDRDVVANLRSYRIIGVLERSRTEVDEQAFVPAGFLRENYRPSGGDGMTVGMVLFEHDRKQSLRFVVGDRTLLDEAREQLSGYFGATYGDGVLKISDPRVEALAIADRYRRLVRVILFLALSALLIATLNMSNMFASRALWQTARGRHPQGDGRGPYAGVRRLLAGRTRDRSDRERCRRRARRVAGPADGAGIRRWRARSGPDRGWSGGVLDRRRRLQRAARGGGGPSAGGRSDPLRVARRRRTGRCVRYGRR